ncbi:hypothetical protein [Mycolicibacterium sp. HK-90]|uniref:hypothetical protein n=1 Tax=Mycolicibacterium sp. HK-90 TaxID=3056937 RepID=UPI002658F582|nr:hypothetical protein [Mycolicibacterium sp. HK-90]WKG05768.1 hypothetical protein QU592_12090 [Mycolicibacterium sp. HK-90]
MQRTVLNPLFPVVNGCHELTSGSVLTAPAPVIFLNEKHNTDLLEALLRARRDDHAFGTTGQGQLRHTVRRVP